jgi:peptide-methionine (S)-S-oxide reductase
VNGIYRTRVGYCGGKEENPTYRNIKDYTEVFEFDYDGDVIDFETIINTFWYSHTPENKSGKMQYKSIIFYRNDEERLIAESSKKQFEVITGKSFNTDIKPISRFYLAENYHQKFFLQNVVSLREEFIKLYPNFIDFINSTVAMKVNSYCKGNGTLEKLMNEINSFGLSVKANNILKDIVEGYGL